MKKKKKRQKKIARTSLSELSLEFREKFSYFFVTFLSSHFKSKVLASPTKTDTTAFRASTIVGSIELTVVDSNRKVLAPPKIDINKFFIY